MKILKYLKFYQQMHAWAMSTSVSLELPSPSEWPSKTTRMTVISSPVVGMVGAPQAYLHGTEIIDSMCGSEPLTKSGM